MRALFLLSLIATGTVAMVHSGPTVSTKPSSPGSERATPGIYLGPVSCAGSSCHGSPHPVEGTGILMNEFDTWVHAEGVSHVNAWNVLLSSRSRAIARRLGLGEAPDRAPACLECHALYVPGQTTENVELADGVSCESCHGPASGWIDHHFRDGWSRSRSLEAGMIDTRDPMIRTEKCLDCHMGTGSVVVDHRLIAAGHPMLTFETDNFTNSGRLPDHWRVGEHPEAHGASAWAQGQLVAFRRNLTQLGGAVTCETWPDFSHLACDSCHHSLSDGDWRLQRPGAPPRGFPHWSAEHWLPLLAILEELEEPRTEMIARDVSLLSSAVSRMVDEDAIRARAVSLTSALRSIDTAVGDLEWSESRLRRVMRRLVEEEVLISTADRRVAEQVVYGLTSLQSERIRLGGGDVDSALTKRIDDLYQLVDESRHPDEFDRTRYLALTREIRTMLR